MRGVLGLLLLLLTAGASAGVVGIIKMPLGKTYEKKLVAPLTWLRELILCARRSFVLTKLLLLFQHCNSIEALNLQHCKKITDRTTRCRRVARTSSTWTSRGATWCPETGSELWATAAAN